MAGYSQTPLARKLGIGEGQRVLLLGVSRTLEQALEPLPAGVRILRRAGKPANVIVACFERHTKLQARLPGLLELMWANSGLWLGWPKKSAGRPTDLNFDRVQGAGLDLGLVDNKICALDETWSGLRMVVRKTQRSSWPRGSWTG